MAGKKRTHGGASFPFSRGIALFFGAFALLNVAAALLGHDAGRALWWVDFSGMESLAGQWGRPCSLVLQALAGAFLLAWAVRPHAGTARRLVTVVLAVFLAAAAFSNALLFWRDLAVSKASALVPLPASLVLVAVLAVLCARIWKSGCLADDGARPAGLVGTVAVAVIAALVFPLVQVATYGTTDHRVDADAIVVPGARVPASGELPPVLSERMDRAVELYGAGLADTVVTCGGTDEGGANEAEAMAAYARGKGVPEGALVADSQATSLEGAVDDVGDLAGQDAWGRVLVASSFYQLPRLEMLCLSRGVDARTVPVIGDVGENGTLESLLRETFAWWACWARCYLLG